jgi:filamentous hemagglutinin
MQGAVEFLEARVVPAAVFAFTEADGDHVTVTTSLGTNADLAAAITLGAGNAYIGLIDLTAAVFAGSDLRVVSAPGGVTGDGLVNVGYVNATGRDIGNVTVEGDLGKLDAGDAVYATAGIKNLTVQSLGKFDTDTGAPNLVSSVVGDAGVVIVKTDVRAARFFVDALAGSGGNAKAILVGGSLVGTAVNSAGQILAEGNVGLLRIGGSLLGGTGNDTGAIHVGGALGTLDVKGSLVGDAVRSAQITADSFGTVKIGGSLVGGDGTESGNIQSTGTLGVTVIKGSLVGGAGVESGRIQVTTALGPITVRGDIQGGDGDFSGSIVTADGVVSRLTIMGSVIGGAGSESGKAGAEGFGTLQVRGDLRGGTGSNSGKLSSEAGGILRALIGGSIIGGSANTTGSLFTDGTLGVLRVGGDLVGGSIDGAADLALSGYIRAGNIVDGIVFGSIIAGSDFSTGTLDKSGSIRAIETIGKLVVKGQVLGNATNAVVISAAGPAVDSPKPAINRLEIGGNAQYLQVLAGYNVGSLAAVNGDASIGTVKIGGDLRGSNIVAGIQAVDGVFGNADDTVIAGNDPDLTARIAMVIVGGQIVNTTAPGDAFGIVAQEIAGLRVGGRVIGLTTGPGNDVFALGTLPDLSLREIA